MDNNERNKEIKLISDNSGGTRWWEFYFVRYAMGTIVGALIIIAISSNKNTHLLHNVFYWGGHNIPFLERFVNAGGHISFNVQSHPSLSIATLILFGAAGLAYCYISSAPILLLHATRYIGPVLSGGDKKFYMKYISQILIILLCISAYMIALAVNKYDYSKYLGLLIFPIALYLCTAVPFYMYLFFRTSHSDKYGRERAFDFYVNLAQARAKSDNEKWRSELIESYRHIREHGNSFFIVLCETLFGLGLFAIAQINNLAILVYITIWSLPAALIWLYGTDLEWQFIHKDT